MESENVRFFSGVGVNSADIGDVRTGLLELQYTTYCGPGGTCVWPPNILNIEALSPPWPGFYDVLTPAGRRAGMVMAATPRTTQARPIQAVRLRVSPRKATLMATPIGTRR